ncbi:hypothetical protein NE237_002083 [Protea cynaroides]|uniref:Uncharacterized protein n=1 Tax=Protea cynaroides TaxID=273540 RepID=A0A9Q0QYZ9_9MAGN|nr:hypothetical protein NE237_002083 [Protea cynaroides]
MRTFPSCIGMKPNGFIAGMVIINGLLFETHYQDTCGDLQSFECMSKRGDGPNLLARLNMCHNDLNNRHSKTVENVMRFLTNDCPLDGVTICNAGCGIDCLSIPFTKQGAIVLSNDISTAMVAKAKKQTREELLQRQSNVNSIMPKFKVRDLESLLGKSSFVNHFECATSNSNKDKGVNAWGPTPSDKSTGVGSYEYHISTWDKVAETCYLLLWVPQVIVQWTKANFSNLSLTIRKFENARISYFSSNLMAVNETELSVHQLTFLTSFDGLNPTEVKQCFDIVDNNVDDADDNDPVSKLLVLVEILDPPPIYVSELLFHVSQLNQYFGQQQLSQNLEDKVLVYGKTMLRSYLA